MDDKYTVNNDAFAHWQFTADELDQSAEDARDLGQTAGADAIQFAADRLRDMIWRFVQQADGTWQLQ